MNDSYYCNICEHPIGYHTADRGCSMPVIIGSNMPRGRNDRDRDCETCLCVWRPTYVIEEAPV